MERRIQPIWNLTGGHTVSRLILHQDLILQMSCCEKIVLSTPVDAIGVNISDELSDIKPSIWYPALPGYPYISLLTVTQMTKLKNESNTIQYDFRIIFILISSESSST